MFFKEKYFHQKIIQEKNYRDILDLSKIWRRYHGKFNNSIISSV
ncbi:hypothetical protein RV01_GL001772 [Enterococcus dispar]|nr:hypothetical protein RV01_GL001772 [Enterococcus dispar]